MKKQDQQWAVEKASLYELINAIPAGIALYEYSTEDIRTLAFNDRLCEMMGYSRKEYQELSANDPLCLIDPEDMPQVMHAIHAYLANDIPTNLVYRVHARHGLMWLSLNTRIARRMPDGKLIAFGVFTDVTAIKTAELEQQRQRYYQQIIDAHLPNGTIFNRFSLSQPPIYVSDSFCKMLGYPRSEVAEMYKTGYRAIIHPEDFTRVYDDNERLKGARTDAFEMQFRFIRRDGSVIWVLEHAKLVSQSNGEDGYLCVFADTTRQKHIDESLRLKEEEYRLAARQSGKLVFRYDPTECTLYTPQEDLADTWFTYVTQDVPYATVASGCIAPESLDAFTSFFEAIRHGQPSGTAEICRKARNGEYRWYRSSFTTLFSDSGEPATAIITHEDITQSREENRRKALDRELLGMAVATVYPMSICANLTQNRYHMIEYSAYTTRKADWDGVFDDLIAVGLSTVPQEDQAAFANAFSRQSLLDAHARGEKKVKLEHRQWGDDGMLRWVETTVIFVDDPHGDDVIELTLAQIIDERKATQQALNEALEEASGALAQERKEHSLIMEKLPACVLVYPAGQDAGRRPPRYIGGRLCERLGYTPQELQELIGDDFRGLVHPDDHDRAHVHARQATAALEPSFEMSFRVRCKNGDLKWVREVSSLTHDPQGTPVYVSVLTDVPGELD